MCVYKNIHTCWQFSVTGFSLVFFKDLNMKLFPFFLRETVKGHQRFSDLLSFKSVKDSLSVSCEHRKNK